VRWEYGYQTCYGISERAIATVIGLHGDNKGLILPPSVAPLHIVIIPILFKNQEVNDKIIDECKRLKSLFISNGYKVEIDESKTSPGAKFFYWEQKGVPLRIEMGPKDLQKNHFVAKRRDNNEKTFISSVDDEKIIEEIKKIMNKIMEDMSAKVAQATRECLLQTEDMQEALDWIEEDKGYAEIPFCGHEDCAAEIEKRVDGLKFLGIPARYSDFLDYSIPDTETGEINSVSKKTEDLFCVVCSKKVDKYWTISRTY
jgi:prolyl-tRNA synthetase